VDVWGDIVTALLRQGKPRDARNAAAAGRQAVGEDRAGVAALVRILELEGQSLLALDSLDEAATTFERAATLRRTRMGGDAAALAGTQAALARVELARGRFDAADAQVDAALAALRASAAPPRRDLAQALTLRAALHAARGAYTAAETAQREAVGLLAGGGAALAGDAAIARLGLARLIARRGAEKDADAERNAALAQLADAAGTAPAVLAAARLERIGQLRRAGKAAEASALITACLSASGAEPPLPPDIAATDDLAAPARCAVEAAAEKLASGAPDAKAAADAALAAIRAHGDAGRPALAAPLALAAAATAATNIDAAMNLSEQALTIADRLPLAERLGVWALRGGVLARAGEIAQAEGAYLAGLQALGSSPPRGLAAELLSLTAGASDALLAQGKGPDAVALWRVALARSERWPGPGPNPIRAALLRGLAGAEHAAGKAEAARGAYQDAARIDEAKDRQAWMADIQGAALAAQDAGRRTEARALAERLLEPGTPSARLANAATRALLAEEADDPVTALLEYARLRALAGEAGAVPVPIAVPGEDDTGDAAILAVAVRAATSDRADMRILALLGEARASLALGRPAAARALLAQARQGDTTAEPGSPAALAAQEIEAGLALVAPLTGPEADAARAAVQAWHDAVRRYRGPGTVAGLRAELALAALEIRAGDVADGAARLSLALGRAARLRGRESLLWSRTALQAADAAEKLGDTARAEALRRAAEAVRARPDPGGAS